jgi:hypothetical protein
MASSLFLVSLAVVVLVFVSQKLNTYLAHLRFKKAHGCKPVTPIYQSERVVGLSLYKSQLKAAKENRVLQTSQSRFAQYGNTWSATMMGQTFYNTIDHENLKHILATNFDNFGIGPRHASFKDLLGRGIFTSDGAHWENSRVR